MDNYLWSIHIWQFHFFYVFMLCEFFTTFVLQKIIACHHVIFIFSSFNGNFYFLDICPKLAVGRVLSHLYHIKCNLLVVWTRFRHATRGGGGNRGKCHPSIIIFVPFDHPPQIFFRNTNVSYYKDYRSLPQ